MFLRIDHTTHYRYAKPVGLTPHLLRLRPRTTPGLHLLKSELSVSPEASVKWNIDLLGNIVGRATFPEETDELLIKSSILLEQNLTNPFDFLLENRAMSIPIQYDERESTLLAAFLRPLDASAASILGYWLKPYLERNSGTSGSPSTIDTLLAINSAIHTLFRYSPRHEQGIWSVSEILTQGEGTCRDFAHLMIEAMRFLGIAARYVSGYLCSSPGGLDGESYTHAWCELYLPGAGWRGFDPTNGILADAHHIVVASSIAAGDIPPVEGSYCGAPDLCILHNGHISARELLPGEELLS
jgi:transglutaminase-like putative cysteine protease